MKEQQGQVQPAQSIMNFYCMQTARISMYLGGVAAVHTESKRKRAYSTFTIGEGQLF